jgi:thiol-disulfide isomerase/thioredoxin
MRVEKGKVHAPEIGRVWLNSTPLSFRQLRGRAVLVDFWDCTCVNCMRTLPYVQAWHERYRDKGLTVIGVHTPEFSFAQYESNVERGIRECGLTYPIVIDGDREIWKAFANRYWPTKYLLDKDGYLRFGHFGEGGYGECEQVIQELLCEIDPGIVLPPLMEPLREEDHVRAVCYRASGELYLGNRRGRIGNEGGFQEDQIADYVFARKAEENFFNMPAAELVILQDGKPLTRKQATRDTRFRISATGSGEENYAVVDSARMYFLVGNHEFGEHELELRCSAGVAAFAFTFTSCVDPVASALQKASVPEP